MAVRNAERTHDYNQAMHGVVERLERLFTLLVLLCLGMAMTRGLLDAARLARACSVGAGSRAAGAAGEPAW